MELVCFACHKSMSFIDKIGRKDECSHCRADLHCCKNCHFYDSKVYNECKETSADVVKEKERSNFCDFFQPRTGGFIKDNKDSLKAAAEALFKSTAKK